MIHDRSTVLPLISVQVSAYTQTLQARTDEDNVRQWCGINLKPFTPAVLLSVWDTSNKDTFSVNLWTKEMPINEMKQFFHQTLVAMKNSYHTATSDEKMAATMQDFCDYFYENMMKE